jgi:hypothetical protein
MRASAAITLLLVAACSQPQAVASSTPSPATSSTPAPVASCQLPVWWGVNTDIHVGRLSFPGGAFSDQGVLPAPASAPDALASFQFYGATYISQSHTWLRANPSLLSPDGRLYAYWGSQSTTYSIHVLDLTTNNDQVIYNGSTLYFPIAFLADGIYMVHAIAPRQGAFEHLYRVSPSGGAIQLVPGSDRHMNQWAWMMIADGAAWGVDSRVEGNRYFYSILRLDLATSQVTKWFEGPADVQFWPDGVDSLQRLFVTDGKQLFRIDSPGHSVELPDPGPVAQLGGPGATPVLFADSQGTWFGGAGGVWLYPNAGAPVHLAAGPPDASVSPAGRCS